MRIPQTHLEVTVIEALSVGVGLRLIVDPSLPVSLGLLALAGAWALEKICVSHARVYRNSSIDEKEAAEKAAVPRNKPRGNIDTDYLKILLSFYKYRVIFYNYKTLFLQSRVCCKNCRPLTRS
jgi:hypothetical protein